MSFCAFSNGAIWTSALDWGGRQGLIEEGWSKYKEHDASSFSGQLGRERYARVGGCTYTYSPVELLARGHGVARGGCTTIYLFPNVNKYKAKGYATNRGWCDVVSGFLDTRGLLVVGAVV